jgi:hypothetical protein
MEITIRCSCSVRSRELRCVNYIHLVMITIEDGRQDFSVGEPILATMLWASQPMNHDLICGRDKRFMFSPRTKRPGS